MGLDEIKKLIIPRVCIEHVYVHLLECGQKRVEGVALMAGLKMDTVFQVTHSIIPAQKGYALEDGLIYSVGGEELHRINLWLYEEKLTLAAQIHSHPGRAYHSETDDRYPIVTVLGGTSIVVPDFGAGEISKRKWAVYRLAGPLNWRELKPEEIEKFIEIK